MEINSSNAKSTPSPNSNVYDGQHPGDYLRKLRLGRKLELAEVAAAIKIPEKQLIALEQDDYLALPQAAFVRGYYRTYARYLHADENLVIQRFESVYSQDTGRMADHALKDSPIKIMGHLSSSGRRGMNKWLKRFLMVLWIGLLLAGIGWALSQWLKKPEAAAPNADNQPEAIEILPIEGATATAQTGDRLVLDISRPTAINISDADGKVLAQGRQAETLTLNGTAPFSIRIDDVGAVSKLQLNNETINLGSYTKSNGSADFRLSP